MGTLKPDNDNAGSFLLYPSSPQNPAPFLENGAKKGALNAWL